MTEWHGWIYARKDQEQYLRSLGVTGAMHWTPTEHREDWVDANGVTHVVGPYLKVADGYFQQCIVKSVKDMETLIYTHTACFAASFTGIDEDGNQLPKEDQIYWNYPPPSLKAFAAAFGCILPNEPTPLERTRAFLTDFGGFLRVLPTTVLNSAGKIYLRLFTNMYVKYLMTVCVHKWYVLQECIKLGIPWQGLFHDISKFRPSEFIPYARYFYGDYPSWDDIRNTYQGSRSGITTKESVSDAFDMAWLKHQHRNKHHWQHWLLVQDDDLPKIIPMPYKHLKEMYADWVGANKAYGDMTLVQWYHEHMHTMRLSQFSREWIDYQLGLSLDYPLIKVLISPDDVSILHKAIIWIKNRRIR